MQDLTHGRGAARSVAGKRGHYWVNLALLVVSVFFSLLLAELIFRLATGIPVFKFADWRTSQVVLKRVGEHAVADPVLGWTLRPWLTDDIDFTTIDYGIRSNFGEKKIRTGAILAVGDSFTEGWDVDNDESWPAYLEDLLGTPVINGGVFGYGTDQIVLRAEQLLPIVKPKILIVGFLEFDIYRSAHSDFGAPKPYFTLVKDALQFHPPKPIDPKAETTPVATIGADLRGLFGYSALADYLMRRLAPNYWHAGSKILYRRAIINPVAVTCALLTRLKKQVDANGIQMLLFMQHNEYLILGGDKSSVYARRVVDCAKKFGIQVVDQFASLRVIAVADRRKLRDYYFKEKDNFGHMTPKGNQHAARLLAEALANMTH